MTDDGEKSSNVLNQVSLPIINRNQCNAPDWLDGAVTSNMICAGYAAGSKDSCQGDSGGPLTCQNKGVWYLEGVISWGEGCAQPKQPGIYVRLTRYVSWVTQVADD